MEDKLFLIRMDRGRFLKNFDGQHITVIGDPSIAERMNYQTAATWVSRLKGRGYPESGICDLTGVLMTYEAMQQALRSLREEAAALPSTREELDAIPVAQIRRKYRTDAAFAARVDELEAQPRTAPGRRQ